MRILPRSETQRHYRAQACRLEHKRVRRSAASRRVGGARDTLTQGASESGRSSAAGCSWRW